MVLDTELAYFESIKADLLKHHEGKFALIVGEEQLGIFDNPEDAYTYGIEQKGNIPMLIKKIQSDEPIDYIPAMVLGLIDAHA